VYEETFKNQSQAGKWQTHIPILKQRLFYLFRTSVLKLEKRGILSKKSEKNERKVLIFEKQSYILSVNGAKW
jgi:hypothetical protein